MGTFRKINMNCIAGNDFTKENPEKEVDDYMYNDRFRIIQWSICGQ